jgi:hypothetical protein
VLVSSWGLCPRHPAPPSAGAWESAHVRVFRLSYHQSLAERRHGLLVWPSHLAVLQVDPLLLICSAHQHPWSFCPPLPSQAPSGFHSPQLPLPHMRGHLCFPRVFFRCVISSPYFYLYHKHFKLDEGDMTHVHAPLT